MAKRTNPAIKKQVMSHIEALYDKYGGKFFDALEDADTKKLNMDFTVTIDLSEAAPAITTQVSFKDKTKESGMNVNKTFSADTTDVLDDPTQPALPGADAKGKKGEKKKGEGEEQPQE